MQCRTSNRDPAPLRAASRAAPTPTPVSQADPLTARAGASALRATGDGIRAGDGSARAFQTPRLIGAASLLFSSAALVPDAAIGAGNRIVSLRTTADSFEGQSYCGGVASGRGARDGVGWSAVIACVVLSPVRLDGRPVAALASAGPHRCTALPPPISFRRGKSALRIRTQRISCFAWTRSEVLIRIASEGRRESAETWYARSRGPGRDRCVRGAGRCSGAGGSTGRDADLSGALPAAVPLHARRALDERPERARLLPGRVPHVLPMEPARGHVGQHLLGPRDQPRPRPLDGARARYLL